MFILFLFPECHSPTQTKLLNSKSEKWPTIAMAVNGNSTVQCTSSIGTFTRTKLVFWQTKCNDFISVSPRWALTSHSCIYGNVAYSPETSDQVPWTLKVGEQETNVKRIYTYPQVNSKFEPSFSCLSAPN